MRRSYEEILNGIEEKSKKCLKQKRARKRTFTVTAVSLLLVVAICVGFAVSLGKPSVKGPFDVNENGSGEQSFPDNSTPVDKSRYLPIAQLSANLMEGVTAEDVESKPIDAAFISAYAELSTKLLGSLYEKDKNALVSPLSAMYALAMLANGAEGETKAQLEGALGGMDTATLNGYMHFLSDYLQGEELGIANSVWVTDNESFMVNPNFLQTNANYYSAELYKTAFDDQTVKDVNAWASEKTKGMIEKIVDGYSGAEVMQLLNALCFEAEWVREAEDTTDLTFHNADGSIVQTDFMEFEERKYISTENAQGVIKDYKGGKYSFVALMPNEGIAIEDYIASLDGKAFTDAVNSVTEGTVKLWMPKFKYGVSMDLIPPLRALGITDAFSMQKANLAGLGASQNGNLFVSSAKQDTFIEVSELGTRAAAITSVTMQSAGMINGLVYLELDRPFVYAIIDNATGMPLFIGALTTLE